MVPSCSVSSSRHLFSSDSPSFVGGTKVRIAELQFYHSSSTVLLGSAHFIVSPSLTADDPAAELNPPGGTQFNVMPGTVKETIFVLTIVKDRNIQVPSIYKSTTDLKKNTV